MFSVTVYFMLCIILISFANGQRWSQWASCSTSDSTADFTCHQKRELECTKDNNSVKGIQCVSSSALYEMRLSDGCDDTACFNGGLWSKNQTQGNNCKGVCYDSDKINAYQCVGNNACIRLDRQRCYNEDTCNGIWTNKHIPVCPATCGTPTRLVNQECRVNGQQSYNCIGTEYGTISTRNVTQDCNHSPCPSWSMWSKTGPCTATCGSGDQLLESKCLRDGKMSTLCEGSTSSNVRSKTETCHEGVCLPEYRPWTQWTSCSCFGQRTRSRTCQSNCANAQRVQRYSQFCSISNSCLTTTTKPTTTRTKQTTTITKTATMTTSGMKTITKTSLASTLTLPSPTTITNTTIGSAASKPFDKLPIIAAGAGVVLLGIIVFLAVYVVRRKKKTGTSKSLTQFDHKSSSQDAHKLEATYSGVEKKMKTKKSTAADDDVGDEYGALDESAQTKNFDSYDPLYTDVPKSSETRTDLGQFSDNGYSVTYDCLNSNPPRSLLSLPNNAAFQKSSSATYSTTSYRSPENFSENVTYPNVDAKTKSTRKTVVEKNNKKKKTGNPVQHTLASVPTHDYEAIGGGVMIESAYEVDGLPPHALSGEDDYAAAIDCPPQDCDYAGIL